MTKSISDEKNKIFDTGNVKDIGKQADNIPRLLLSYAPGIDETPTRFAVDKKDGKIYAFVDKKGEFYGNKLGSLPELGECRKYIIKHGQDVTKQVKRLVEVSEFWSSDE